MSSTSTPPPKGGFNAATSATQRTGRGPIMSSAASSAIQFDGQMEVGQMYHGGDEYMDRAVKFSPGEIMKRFRNFF